MSNRRSESQMKAGTLIHDRYEVVRALGTGASATTYLCKDLEDGLQEVAVKAMRLNNLDAWKSFELFERESRVLGSLHHHSIPDLHDVFRLEDDEVGSSFYLVQEFIDGRSLDRIIEDGDRLSEPELLQLVMGLLDVLDYLHTQAPPLYHRDIKPSNIIIRPMGSPVLVDFGSVRDGWRHKDEHGSTIAGTHGYMPPEQYMGQVSAASDIYALGATLLHVVTGRHPSSFPFDTGRIEVPDQMDCAPGVEALIKAALEPAPIERPESAKDARRIMLDTAPTQPAAASPSTALALRSETIPTAFDAPSEKGKGPLFVEMGPPPRDPHGKDSDLYRMYMGAMFSFNLGRSLVRPGGNANKNTAGGFIFFLMMFACTGGLWLLIVIHESRSRKKTYEHLFLQGFYTTGTILGAQGAANQQHASVVYTYTAEGKTYRHSTPVTGEVSVFFIVGDPVGVLYNKQDPQDSVIVFR